MRRSRLVHHALVVDENYQYTSLSFLSEYDRTKWKAHYEVARPLMQAGLPLMIALPGLVYGPGDTSIIHEAWVNYLRGKLPMTPADTAYCWGHVDDIAHGHLLTMERGKVGESYIIAGPKYSVVEAFTLAEQISGVPAPRLHPVPWMMKALTSMIGLLGAVFPLPVPTPKQHHTLQCKVSITPVQRAYPKTERRSQ